MNVVKFTEGSGGDVIEMDLNCGYDVDSAADIPKGKVEVTCKNSSNCNAATFRCVPKNDYYNGTVESWTLDNIYQTNQPRFHNSLKSCINGTVLTIESSGDLKCGVLNN